jgi:hypothetical protein
MDPTIEAAIIGSAGAIVAGGIAAGVAVLGFRKSSKDNRETLTRTLEAGRQGQLPERLSRAIEQLGSEVLDVRLGGIYALERVAADSARDHPTVMEVLSAFIREHSSEQWPPLDPEISRERSTRPDVQAALTVIGRRDAAHDLQPIDLHNTDLHYADLTRANLAGANLSDANLTGVFLNDADLSKAYCYGTIFTRAYLSLLFNL